METERLETQFVSLTGASLSEASQILQMNGFDLQRAVDMYYNNMNEMDDIIDEPVSYTNSKRKLNYDDDDDYVRAPDAVKVQRLIENPIPTYYSASVPSTFLNGSGRDLSEKEMTLANLYKPPQDIMFQGDFYEARQFCKHHKKWLLVNIQSEDEFSCHILNRDVWSDETVKEIVRCNFIFWQKHNTSREGAEYMDRYKVVKTPYISVIDPRTASVVWKQDGPFLGRKDEINNSIIEKLINFGDFEQHCGDLGITSTATSTSSYTSSSSGHMSLPMTSLQNGAGATAAPSTNSVIDVDAEVEDLPPRLRRVMVTAPPPSTPLDQQLPTTTTTTTSTANALQGSTNTSSSLFPIIGFSVSEIDRYTALATRTSNIHAFNHHQSNNNNTATSTTTKIQMRIPQPGKSLRIVREFATSDSIWNLVAFISSQIDESHHSSRFDILVGGYPVKSLAAILLPPLLDTSSSRSSSSLGIVDSNLTVDSLGVSAGAVTVRFLN